MALRTCLDRTPVPLSSAGEGSPPWGGGGGVDRTPAPFYHLLERAPHGGRGVHLSTESLHWPGNAHHGNQPGGIEHRGGQHDDGQLELPQAAHKGLAHQAGAEDDQLLHHQGAPQVRQPAG